MRHIFINETAGEINKFYPYRQAMVTNWNIKVILNSADLVYLNHILKESGYQLDNHIVFCTDKMNYWLHDGVLLIGGTVVKETY